MGNEEQEARLRIVAYTAAAAGALGGLAYATVTGVDDWAGIVVLVGVVLATIGVMFAIDPLRRR